ncbi:MAG TPA: hypothetical protein VJQ25_02940, partial [Nitrospira sp.]|nr:hypothetical protein [Nitrospira sp.]
YQRAILHAYLASSRPQERAADTLRDERARGSGRQRSIRPPGAAVIPSPRGETDCRLSTWP